MSDEQIFELAEKNSFQDDSGCWIFKDEGLLDFVFMVQKAERKWIGLSVNEARDFYEKYTNREELIYAIDKFLEEKNT
jgi:hypothetical protein